ncbi:MAG: hypothetical protein A2340_02790 [Lentisphaerae bacterium RIFOXYB12_FULL_60_10]|nr:MAG: hypothetical protein A2340_02790 [Lentisphaerae bacterium RIFOXYB12_FULL_60_10]
MDYTSLGKTGLQVSRLGFGCMRLPMTDNGTVNRDLAIPLLRHAVERGINYFDTAIFYCHGDSQRVVGEALEGMRDRVVLSTKNHLHEAEPAAWWERLEESLRFLRTTWIDVYNLHGMTWDTWTRRVEPAGGKLELLLKAKEQGLIRHICCSFHDSPDALVKLADTGVFEAVTVQYNLLDRSLEDAIRHCRERGIGVVVMGPVGGGRLGIESQRIRELTATDVESTPEAALRFVLAHPGVTVALSGMSDLAMLEQNVHIVSTRPPFTRDQIQRIDAEIQRIRDQTGVRCPACGYCQPCPAGVDIPGNFAVYNEYRLYGLEAHSRRAYAGLAGRAALCTECGTCLAKCPQKIPIPTTLRDVMRELDPDMTPIGSLMSVHAVKPDGAIDARILVRNLGPQPLDTSLTLQPEYGTRCEPDHVALGSLAPDAAQRVPISARLQDGVGIFSGTVNLRAGDQERLTPFRIPMFLVPSDRIRWHAAMLKPADFGGNTDLPATHGYRVGLRHDDERIFLTIDIRSQLQALAAAGAAAGSRIELYVDMRPPDQGGRTAPYTDGAEQFLVSLGEPGHGTKSGRIYPLNQRNDPTPDGVRVRMELPFAEFLKPGWPVPHEMGLDIMFVVATRDGIERGYPTYGGHGGLWQNPRLFARAWLL